MIYNENCIEVMRRIESETIDCCVTDPPYKLTSGGCVGSGFINGHFRNADGTANATAKSGKVFEHNDIDFIDWMPEVFRILKDGSHFYCMCNHLHLKDVLTIGEQVGFKEQNVLVWEKGMHTPTQFYFSNIEFIVMFRKGKAKYINNIGTFALLKIQGLRDKKHPSQKPIGLFQKLIENSTQPNEIVIDPFMGMGTTAIACERSNRQYVGSEIDETFYTMAIQNMKNILSQTQLFNDTETKSI